MSTMSTETERRNEEAERNRLRLYDWTVKRVRRDMALAEGWRVWFRLPIWRIR